MPWAGFMCLLCPGFQLLAAPLELPSLFPNTPESSSQVWFRKRTCVFLVDANPPGVSVPSQQLWDTEPANYSFPFWHKPLPLSCRDPRQGPSGEMRQWKTFPLEQRKRPKQRAREPAIIRLKSSLVVHPEHRMCGTAGTSHGESCLVLWGKHWECKERTVRGAASYKLHPKLLSSFFFCLHGYKTTSRILEYSLAASSTEIK